MITATIVLYHNDEKVLRQAVNSFMALSCKKLLYLIDNSRTDYLRQFYTAEEIVYIHNKENIGFGRAHNLIMEELKLKSDYHLVLNPDTYFSAGVIPSLISFLDKDETIGVVAPKILYPNGTYQKSIRKFPRPQDFLIRRIPFLSYIFKEAYKKTHYLDIVIENPIYVDAVSGCFQLFRTKTFTSIQGFDERYFMYMEDIDICRKVHEAGAKVLYVPNVVISHHSEYGSKKKVKLLLAHIKSIVKYYAKWKRL